MINLIIKIFFAAFFINLLYEISHSVLYETCLKASFKKYIYLILKGAMFDGLAISIIYFATYLIFNSQNILSNYYQFVLFFSVSLIFAYFWEIYSIKAGKWEYSDKMPLIFGVGITPVIQLTLTGILSLYIVFNFY